jgi:hypothetical protein
MDELEKYINANREKFDDKDLPKTLWGKIAAELDQDSLEDFVKTNKEAFSDKNPPISLWDNINTQLGPTQFSVQNNNADKKQKLVPISYMWRMAAAFLVLITATVWIQYKIFNAPEESNKFSDELAQNKDATLEGIDPELLDAERYYESMIDMRKNELANYDLVSLGLQDEFKYDINLLDSAYSEIKEEILQGNTNDMLVNAMIDNLQQRMEILNRQLEILKNLHNKETQNENTIIQS